MLRCFYWDVIQPHMLRNCECNDQPVALFSTDMSQPLEDLVEKWLLWGLCNSEMDSKQPHLVRWFPVPWASGGRAEVWHWPAAPQTITHTEHHSLSYTNICLCLNSFPALSHVSTETEGQGNVRHTNVHLASWNDIAAVEEAVLFEHDLLWCVFHAHIPTLTKCLLLSFKINFTVLKVDALMQTRFDKYLESDVFGQAPFVGGKHLLQMCF